MSILVYGVRTREATPPGGGSSGPPPLFTPNPDLALSVNEVKPFLAYNSAGMDSFAPRYIGIVYDDTNHCMWTLTGGHQASNFDSIGKMDLSSSTAFVPEYAASTAAQWAQSNYSIAKGAWLLPVNGGVGPYPRPVARHTMDALACVDGVFMVLGGVEGNQAPISYPNAQGGDPLHSLWGGAPAHYDATAKTWTFPSQGGSFPFFGGTAVDGSDRVWCLQGSVYASLFVYDIPTTTMTQVYDLVNTYIDDPRTGGHLDTASLGYNNTMVRDPRNDKLYYFTGGGTSPVTGQIYEIDPAAVTVSKLPAGSGTAMVSTSPQFSTRTYCFDSVNNLFLAGPSNGVMYAWDRVTNHWSSKTLSIAGLHGVWCAMDFNPVDNCAIFLGAVGNAVEQSSTIYAYRWA
jgi:hypothetical protein